MRYFALPRKDGGVEILQTNGNPMEKVAKWHPNRKAEITGAFREIQKTDIPTDRSWRKCWKLTNGKVVVDEVQRAEIEAAEK